MLPCGISNETYAQDIAIVRTKLQWCLLIGFVIFMFAWPPFTNVHTLSLIINICVAVVAVLGLYLLTGLCGQISLGQAAFVAIGAYTTAIMMSRFGYSYWLALPCSAVLAAVVGLIFGIPSLKVKGFYLAMATLAAQFIIMWVITHPPLSEWTGAFDGLAVSAPTLGGMDLSSFQRWFFVVMAIMWVMVFFAKNIARTKVGRAFIAIRDNDLAAEVMGINVFRYKLLAFTLCSFFAGIAGSLFAPFAINVSPQYFTLMNSIWYLGMLIVGGMGSVVGVICGTVFIQVLSEITTMYGPTIGAAVPVLEAISGFLGQIVFGLVIILFLIFEPRGINHRWEIFKASYRIHPFAY